MNDHFKTKLVRGDLLVGTIITLPSPEIAEILSRSGFHWLFVDLEHGTLGIRDAQRILQAASSTPCVIRVPSNDEVWIKKALDTGPAGIMIPQVRSAADAAQAVRFCKYPPLGQRSVGIARAHGYGAQFETYVATANEGTAVIVQIEHIDAVDRIQEILGVAGIDGLFIGPYDLSASMGKTGQVDEPSVRKAIARVRRAAQQAGMPLGIFGATVEAVEPYIENGYTLVAVGMDSLLIGNAAGSIAGAFT